MSSEIKAKVILEIDNSTINKELTNTEQKLKSKLNNLGTQAGKKASQELSKNIQSISNSVEKAADKASKILEKGLKFGLGLGTASIAAFLTSGTKESLKFKNQLDNLKVSVASVGEKLATKVKFGDKNLSQWVDVLITKLNSLDVSKLQKIVDIGKNAAIAWAGFKVVMGGASVVGGLSKIGAFNGLSTAAASGVGAAGGLLLASLSKTILSIGKDSALGINKLLPTVTGRSMLPNMGEAAVKYGSYSKIPFLEKSMIYGKSMMPSAALMGASTFASGGYAAGRMSYAYNKQGMTAGFNDIPGISAKFDWVWGVIKQFSNNVYNAFKPLESLNILDIAKNVPNALKSMYGQGGVPTNEELTDADKQRIANSAAEVSQRTKELAITKRENELIDRSFDSRKSMRDYNRMSTAQAERYVGEVPFDAKVSNLYGMQNIEGRIKELDSIIADYNKELEKAPKALKGTLEGLLNEAIGNRSTLVGAKKDIYTSFLAQEARKKDFDKTLSGFDEQLLKIDKNYAKTYNETDFSYESKRKDLEDAYNKSLKPKTAGTNTLGMTGPNIQDIFSNALLKGEEARMSKEEEYYEYKKALDKEEQEYSKERDQEYLSYVEEFNEVLKEQKEFLQKAEEEQKLRDETLIELTKRMANATGANNTSTSRPINVQ